MVERSHMQCVYKRWVARARMEGTPQGGPLSPLLSNILLTDLDRELEKRGHRFCRYADDCNMYVGSARSGHRVVTAITAFLERRRKLKVNAAKSAVARPWQSATNGRGPCWNSGASHMNAAYPKSRFDQMRLVSLLDTQRHFSLVS